MRDTVFEVATRTFQLRPPRVSLVVVVKATFALAPNECALAEEQLPCMGERFVDDDPDASLLAPSDLSPVKTRAECYVLGACHPPGDRATTCVASFRVGRVARSLAVFGDRAWPAGASGSPSAPAPFSAMPLTWERSFGGRGLDANPVGRGIAAGSDGRIALPNLEDPTKLVQGRGERPAPASFAPIHPGWAARAKLLGTYDASWAATRWPWLPVDFDPSFYNACPISQRIDGFFRGDEPVELVNLLGGTAALTTRLPGLKPRCFLEAADPKRAPRWREVPLALDTIGVHTEERVVTCTWRGNTDVASDALEEFSALFAAHEPLREPRAPEFYAIRLAEKRAEKARDEAEHEAAPVPPLEVAATAPVPAAAAPPLFSPAPAGLADLVGHLFGKMGAPMPEEFTDLLRSAAKPVSARAPEARPPAARELVTAKLAAGEPLARMDLTGADLSWMNLSGADLTGAILANAQLDGTTLEGARLDDASLAFACLVGAALPNASACRADFTGAKADRAIFDEAVLDEATLSEASLLDTSFRRASCRGADLSRANLTSAVLTDAALEGADLSETVLDGADLSRATLGAASLAGAKGRRVKLVDCDVERLRATGAELAELDASRVRAQSSIWSGAKLERAMFRFSDLERADFDDASLGSAALTGCKLAGARFRGATLKGVTMLGADAKETCFEAADLTDADLRGSSLYCAAFWKAKTTGAKLDDADLSRTLLERRPR